MKFSLNIGGKEIGFSLGSAAVAKSLTSDFLKGSIDDSSGSGATMVNPYSQSAWIYVAINVIAKNLSQIPFRISRGGRDGENLVESGPVVDLFNRPHRTMDRGLFWANVVSWDCLRGEFFILPLDRSGGTVDLTTGRAKIAQMITLTPDMLWHMVQGYDLNGWRYTGSPLTSPIESQVLMPEELIHARTFNPYLYWRGLSPLTVAMLAASTDYASAQFMKGLMMNNADTGVIVTTEQQPSAEQREQILAALRDRKRKAGTADRPLFLTGGATVTKPSVSSADMQFLENRKMNRQEVGAIYGVSDIMMGFSEQRTLGTGAGAEQERYNFIESTLTPICRRLEAAVEPIVKSFGADLFGWFDVDSLPVMQEARRTRVDTATKAFAMGVPFNDINKLYQLGFENTPAGDKSYLPFNLTEVGTTPPEGEDAAPTGDPNAKLANPFARLLSMVRVIPPAAKQIPAHVCTANPAWENSIAGSVKLKKGKLTKFFFEQRGRVLAKLNADTLKAEMLKSKSLDDLFNAAEEDAKLIAKLKPLILADLQFGGAQIYSEISAGIDFTLAPADAIAYLEKRSNVISDINATTWDAVKTSLQAGLSEGASFDELAQGVKEVFQSAGDARANVIALTETTVATNSGRMNAMTTAGVERKGWKTSHLENTRISHWQNEELSAEQNGIPIDDLWPNGCAFPGDPDGEPGETINCRCFGYAVKAKDGAKFQVPSSKFLRFEEWMTKQILKAETLKR